MFSPEKDGWVCLDDGAVGIGKTLEIGKDRLRPMACGGGVCLSFGSDSLIGRGCVSRKQHTVDGLRRRMPDR